jgi:ATP-dependent RNA helicase RhlE
MAPTRELAQQIEEECRMISRGSTVMSAVLIGGTSMGPQLNQLRRRPQLIIGTPGRIKDHIERRSLDVSRFNIVVLDEVDRMLDMGFVNDMKHILGKLSSNRQSFFFSATMSPTVEGLIKTFTSDAVTISVRTSQTSENVEQDVVHYSSVSDKMQKLQTLLKSDGMDKALIFGETQRGVERLHKQLQESGFATDAIHGGKSQGARQRALSKFKRSEVTILVATDVAARGIDVKDITHVVNYTTPQSYDDYTHRVGRAGRAGRSGYAFTFIES